MSKRAKAVAYVELVIFVLEMVGFLFKKFKPIDVMNYLFSTGGPSDAYHFQWVGITVLVAVIGFFVNQYWEQRKLRADLKYKSSIEWMEKFRDLIADFAVAASSAQQAQIDYLVVLYDDDVDNAKLEPFRIANNAAWDHLQKTYQLLFLYTPGNENTSDEKYSKKIKLMGLINAVYQKIIDNSDKLDDANKGLEDSKQELLKIHKITIVELDNLIAKLMSGAKDYLGHEWQQASEGK